MKLDLSGKTALVTGGARGIGAFISRTLGTTGVKVVINYNKSGDRAEKLRDELCSEGFESEIFQADVSEPAQVDRLFQFIRSYSGQLDILVNNAGVIRDTLLLSMSVADWDKVHDVNLRGAFLTTRMAAELMVPRHCGKMINIASIHCTTRHPGPDQLCVVQRRADLIYPRYVRSSLRPREFK